MAEIKIGGQVHKTAPMNFVAWPIAWPIVSQLAGGNAASNIDDQKALFKFIACAVVMTQDDADQLNDDGMAARIEGLALDFRRKFRMPELAGLQGAVPAILEENGFSMGGGQAAAGNAKTTTSTATLTASSAAS